MASSSTLKTATAVLKGLELSLSLIVMLMGRVITGAAVFDEAGYIPYGDPTSVDEIIIGDMVAYGFFYIILVQTVSIALGEEPLKMHFIFDVIGGIGYIAVGSFHLAFWTEGFLSVDAAFVAAGVVAIFTGVALLCGAVVWAMRIAKQSRD